MFPDATQIKLIIFDFDGVLAGPIEGNRQGYPRHVEDRQWIDGRLEQCMKLREAHYELAIATNQGGAASHIFSPRRFWKFLLGFVAPLDIYLLEVCYFHPNGNHPRFGRDSELRKPKPGMLYSILDHGGFSPDQALMVGDRKEDEMAANLANVMFVPEVAFFAQGGVCDFLLADLGGA